MRPSSTTAKHRAFPQVTRRRIPNLAVLLHGKADLDGAAAHYEAALKLRPHDPETNYNFALLAQERGDADMADRHFQLARKLTVKIIKDIR